MLPTHRVAKARRDKRRSHHALKAIQTATCPNCGAAKLPHAACRDCGYVKPGLRLKTGDED